MASDKYKFLKLTPVQDADINIYKDALDFVFENQDIRNIAISGAYSAGKSSIIESYKQANPKKKFLHISLAYFEAPDSYATNCGKNTKPTAAEDNEKDNILEGKILNQLIHQIDAGKIPQTNFRVKKNVSWLWTAIQTIGVVVFVLLMLLLVNFHSWKLYVENHSALQSWFYWSTTSGMPLICVAISALLLGWFLYTILQMQKNKGLFKKLSVQGNEIEIFAQADDSYFDKYLNEVLYLFEHSDAEVIVFEDMDRYNTNHIFQRLREVNTLVNNHRVRQKKTLIRFFYLLRDDIFVSKDRTKFFDFIIPVVPILDGSNSYDQFITHFKQGGILELFDENFLQGISLYVDDMRILKNIYNEFIVYNARISTTEQDANKLLAMIVYKNIFPRDFSDLQLNKGFVFSLFDSREKFAAGKIATLREIVSDIKSRIDMMEKEALQSEKEIDFIYTNYRPYRDNYNRLYSKHVAERDARKERLKEKRENGITKLHKEAEELERQINVLGSQKLSEIIDRDNIESIFQITTTNEIGEVNNFNEIKSSDYFDLLKYLIREGFIDETYPDYMTYFYENSLSRNDKVFLRSVTDQKAKEYTYRLQKPEIVVRRLRLADFEKEETLNFDLLYYMLQNQYASSRQLFSMVKQLESSRKYDFIIRFMEGGRGAGAFIRILNSQWPQMFGKLLEESRCSNEQKKFMALMSLYHSPKEDLEKVDTGSALSNFISHCPDFLQIEEPQVKTLISGFELLWVRFVEIDYGKSHSELWRSVYANNLYELNWNMIESILENQYNIPRSDTYLHENLSLIFSEPSEYLVEYVKANFKDYFTLMLDNCNESISDSESVALYAINHGSLEDDQKQRYIDFLTTKISSLEGIKDSRWWARIMDNELLLYSEDNVLCYFFGIGKKYDSRLIRFINDYASTFLFRSAEIDQKYGEESSAVFFKATVKCNGLNNDKYSSILEALRRHYTSFAEEGINDDKIEILINRHIIRMNLPVLLFMREHYPDQVVRFIEARPKDYVESTINEEVFLMKEMLDVLHSSVDNVYKIALIQFTDEPISIQNEGFASEVEAYILDNRFSVDDLTYVLKNYELLATETQRAIERLVVKQMNRITTYEYQMPYTLLVKIMSNNALDRMQRLELFSYFATDFDSVQCKDCLKMINETGFLSLFENKRPKFKISDVNKRILEAFQEKGWITRFEIEDDAFYRAFGRKPRITDKLPDELL